MLEQIRANIKKWLEALESGEYKQGSNALCSIQDGIPHYCCLGVANEVCDLGESDEDSLISTYSLIGLRCDCGGLASLYSEYFALTNMNDSKRFSFKEIAAYIKNNPKNVFTEEVAQSLIDNPIW